MTALSNELLLELTDHFGSPLYVFEEQVIRDRCRELRSAITYPHSVIRYACKALTLQAVLNIVREEGLWIDASSLNEVKRCLYAGFKPEEIYYTGEGATLSVYRELITANILINCTSIDHIRLLERAGGRACSLRVNPGAGDGETHKTNTGGPSSKHGIYFDQLEVARHVAAEAGIRVIGVHAHIGSGSPTIRPWLRIKELTLKIAKGFPDLRFVNLGGGLPVVYNEETDKKMPVREWGREISRAMRTFSKTMGRTISLHVEPGRYIVAHSGSLLAEVQAVKSTPRYRFAIVNTGLNHNVRPAMYGSYHPIRFIRRSPDPTRRKLRYVIAGYLCESGDVFTVRSTKSQGSGVLAPRAFETIAVGDIMVMGCVGAYSHAMKSEYNSMNAPASVLVRSDLSTELIERRGTLDDIIRREREAAKSRTKQRFRSAMVADSGS